MHALQYCIFSAEKYKLFLKIYVTVFLVKLYFFDFLAENRSDVSHSCLSGLSLVRQRSGCNLHWSSGATPINQASVYRSSQSSVASQPGQTCTSQLPCSLSPCLRRSHPTSHHLHPTALPQHILFFSICSTGPQMESYLQSRKSNLSASSATGSSPSPTTCSSMSGLIQMSDPFPVMCVASPLDGRTT